jgi:hypothetical protein
MKSFFIGVTALFIFTACSCTPEEPTYTPTELWELGVKRDPSLSLVVVNNHEPERRVVCIGRVLGCVEGSGKRVLVRETIELLVIQFETTAQARAEALRIGQWHARNWVFDEVANEPVLISFIKEAFNAENPSAKK